MKVIQGFYIVEISGTFNVCIKPTVGELLRPLSMDAVLFKEKQAKLGGMYEHVGKAKCEDALKKISEITNLGICDSSDENNLRYSFLNY